MPTKIMKKPERHLLGLTGKAKRITYTHGMKFPHVQYGNLEATITIEVELEEGDDLAMVMDQIKKSAHQEVESALEERKQNWRQPR